MAANNSYITVEVEVSLDVANLRATLDAIDVETTMYRGAKLKSTLRGEDAMVVATGVVVDGSSSPGESIMTYSPWKIIDNSHILVLLERTHARPASMDAHTAVLHAVSLIQATALEVSFLPKATNNEWNRIVVVGGETPLAAGLVQVLKSRLPTSKIHITACIKDQWVLFQRIAHLMKLGKIQNEEVGGVCYAIDGSIPDLTNYGSLRDELGVACIINAGSERQEVRADLRELLEVQSRVFDCHAVDMTQALSRSIGVIGADLIAEVQSWVFEAAEVFTTEEISQCSFHAEDEL